MPPSAASLALPADPRSRAPQVRRARSASARRHARLSRPNSPFPALFLAGTIALRDPLADA